MPQTMTTSRGQRDAATAGFVVLIAGVVTTPVGWIMYASNRTRLKQIDDQAHASTEIQSQVRVGVVGVGLGGLGLGGLATF